MELDPPKSAAHSNVTVVVRSRQKNGIVLYRGGQQHLAVELFRGRLRVSYGLGSAPAFTMFSLAVSGGRRGEVQGQEEGEGWRTVFELVGTSGVVQGLVKIFSPRKLGYLN